MNRRPPPRRHEQPRHVEKPRPVEPSRPVEKPPERSNDKPAREADRIVCGAGPVGELVARKPGAIKRIWVDPQRAGRRARDPVADIIVAARQANVTVEDRARDQLDKAAGEGVVHQGVLAWLGPFQYTALDEMLTAATPGPALVVALDGVEDPRNLGAVIRSAYLLGAHGVIIPEHRAAQVTPVVAKTSAGASEILPIALVGNLAQTLEELRERGLWRVAVHASETAQPLATIDAKMPLCLVLGAEGTGIRPLVARNCDFHAIIPMAGGRTAVGSFNVSVAAAIALYEISRGRSGV